MLLTETAKIYHNLGLSVIPAGKDKRPRLSDSEKFEYAWKKHQSQLLQPNGNFDKAWGIAIVCGKISGGLEAIDIDSKNDLTGTLIRDYKTLINEFDKNLLKKLLVEQSPSGGLHFIYRCSEISGNKKLARRLPTPDETNLKQKTIGLIETRGEGGYFVCSPSEGYKIIYGSFDKISQITPEERNILLDCAYTFNTYVEPIEYKKPERTAIASHSSPFDDWNERGDVVSVLTGNGWEVARKHGNSIMLKRPQSQNAWSASYDTERKIFFVWSTSTEFEPEKGYNHTGVLVKSKFNGDYSAAAKWLLDNNYGEKTETKVTKTPKSQINIEDENFDFVATPADTDEYINQVRDGSFKIGLTTGFPTLDEHWRIKPASLVIVNGHDNVGKSFVMWYLAMISAKLHGWKWIIYSSENKMGGIKKKIIEFALHKNIKDLSEKELGDSYKWFDEHFVIIKNKNLFNYMDMINMAKKLLSKKRYDGFLIDPFNSLDTDDSNKHDFDYRALSQFRLFIEQTQCSVYINCHAVTEALRRKYPKGHAYEGYPMPPDKSDTEGGGKFSNKADDFLTIHRLVQHPTDFYFTEIHVKKIKEMETGGKHTSLDSPVKLKMTRGSLGFEDENGFNPITRQKEVHKPTPITPNPNTFTEPRKEEEDNNSDSPF